MIRMIEVSNSKAISAYHYDAVERILSVHFKNAKQVHHYHDVPPEEAAKFEKAESLGKHHAAHIKGKFHHTSVDA